MTRPSRSESLFLAEAALFLLLLLFGLFAVDVLGDLVSHIFSAIKEFANG